MGWWGWGAVITQDPSSHVSPLLGQNYELTADERRPDDFAFRIAVTFLKNWSLKSSAQRPVKSSLAGIPRALCARRPRATPEWRHSGRCACGTIVAVAGRARPSAPASLVQGSTTSGNMGGGCPADSHACAGMGAPCPTDAHAAGGACGGGGAEEGRMASADASAASCVNGASDGALCGQCDDCRPAVPNAPGAADNSTTRSHGVPWRWPVRGAPWRRADSGRRVSGGACAASPSKGGTR